MSVSVSVSLLSACALRACSRAGGRGGRGACMYGHAHTRAVRGAPAGLRWWRARRARRTGAVPAVGHRWSADFGGRACGVNGAGRLCAGVGRAQTAQAPGRRRRARKMGPCPSTPCAAAGQAAQAGRPRAAPGRGCMRLSRAARLRPCAAKCAPHARPFPACGGARGGPEDTRAAPPRPALRGPVGRLSLVLCAAVESVSV